MFYIRSVCFSLTDLEMTELFCIFVKEKLIKQNQTIMTIDEAIRARLDRFNRLWKKAVGYTFEEEPEVLGK